MIGVSLAIALYQTKSPVPGADRLVVLVAISARDIELAEERGARYLDSDEAQLKFRKVQPLANQKEVDIYVDRTLLDTGSTAMSEVRSFLGSSQVGTVVSLGDGSTSYEALGKVLQASPMGGWFNSISNKNKTALMISTVLRVKVSGEDGPLGLNLNDKDETAKWQKAEIPNREKLLKASRDEDRICQIPSQTQVAVSLFGVPSSTTTRSIALKISAEVLDREAKLGRERFMSDCEKMGEEFLAKTLGVTAKEVADLKKAKSLSEVPSSLEGTMRAALLTQVGSRFGSREEALAAISKMKFDSVAPFPQLTFGFRNSDGSMSFSSFSLGTLRY